MADARSKSDALQSSARETTPRQERTGADDARQRHVLALLGQALSLEDTARLRFLDQACEGDLATRAEVESLLAEEGDLGDGFLEAPTKKSSREERLSELKGKLAPERLGPYRVLEKLGRGGMGTVYLGEQERPVRRRVALKVTDAMHHRRQGKRFIAECQALARLNHPNVASLYEVGETEEGYPYVAMELVEGAAIDRWCDQRKLSLRQRIELFIGTCAGVRHAHEKGILHRDLKPSNILVTEVDGQATSKVIDFGIARALDEPLLKDIQMTMDHQLVGSPAYMSPEVAAGERDIDTRSDVYSLGLVLYKLVVGVLPFEVDNETLATLLERLSRADIEPPIARFSSLDDKRQQKIAKDRSLTVKGLIRRVHGDLEAILRKATAHDREPRYSSPADLARDLERHLRKVPIEARPRTAPYLIGRFVRRRLGLVASIGLLICALGVGIIARTLEAQRAMRALDESEAISNFLISLLEVSDPRQSQGETLTARELLDRGAAEIQSTLHDQPLAKARFMRTIGGIYQQLGLYEQAEPLLIEGLAIKEEAYDAEHPELALDLEELASLYRLQGRYGPAEALFQRLVLIRERQPARPLELASALSGLGRVYLEQGLYHDAEPLIERALELEEGVLGGTHPDLAGTLDGLGAVYYRQGRLEKAESLRVRALTIREKFLGPDHPAVATSLNNIAVLYRATDRNTEAEAYLLRSLYIRERVLGADHPYLASSLNNLGDLYRSQGRLTEAEPLLKRALAIKRQGLEPNHPQVANSLSNLGLLYMDSRRFAEAEDLIREALGIRKEVFGVDHEETAQTEANLAAALYSQGKTDKALALYERAWHALKTLKRSDDSAFTDVIEAYASLLRELGFSAEAELVENSRRGL